MKRFLLLSSDNSNTYNGLLETLSQHCIIDGCFHKKAPVTFEFNRAFFSSPDFKPKHFILHLIDFLKFIIHAPAFINQEKYDIIFLTNSYLVFFKWILLRVPMTNSKLIVFKYDITHHLSQVKSLLMRIWMFFEFRAEEYFFTRADKLLFKGAADDLKVLPFYKKIESIPSMLYRAFMTRKFNQPLNTENKLSKTDNEIHLVHEGTLWVKDTGVGDSFITIAKRLTSQKMHVHIYTLCAELDFQYITDSFKGDPYFHLEKGCKQDELIKKMTRYDYGLYLVGSDNMAHMPQYALRAFGNKLFDYISAGIPIIVNEELLGASSFVTDNQLGVAIPFKDIPKLKHILDDSSLDYTSQCSHLLRYRNDYNEDKKVVDFILND